MKKTYIAAIVLATIPFQGASFAAYAQSGSADPQFVDQLRSALRQNPELVLEAAALAQQKQKQAEVTRMNEMAEPVRKELAAAGSPGFAYGNPEGSKVYVEFLDYRCGYCKRAHPEVKQVVSADKDARFVMIMRPVLGPQSETLARFVTAAAQQGKFADAHAYLYENEVDASDAGLEAAASAIGLDWAKVRSDMTGEAVTSTLAKHQEYGDRMQVNGTPFFITPNSVIPGATDANTLRAAG